MIAVSLPLTPALSPGRGSRSLGFSKFAFDSESQVGGLHPFNSVGPLSLLPKKRELIVAFKT
jgi:hypothetical protein